jgi:hypothetical protein
VERDKKPLTIKILKTITNWANICGGVDEREREREIGNHKAINSKIKNNKQK